MIGIGMGMQFGSGLSAAQQVAAIYASGALGAWLDPSEAMSAPWYQDSAGATPITAVEQPVGRALDKSGGGNHFLQATSAARPVLSALVNLLLQSGWAGAAAGTPGTAPTSWGFTVAGGSIDSVVPDSSGQNTLSFSTVAARHALSQTRSVAASATYTLSADVVSNTGLTVSQIISIASAPAGSAITYRINGVLVASTDVPVAGDRVGVALVTDVTAGTASVRLGIGTSSAALLTGTVALKRPQFQRGGMTAYQGTTASYDTAGFPYYKNFDGIDDSMTCATAGGGTAGFFWCGAIKTGSAGALRTIWSDAGANSGYKVEITAANLLQLSAGDGASYTAAAAADALTAGKTHLLTVWDDGTNLNAQLDGGAVTTVARPVVTAGTAGMTEGKDNGAASGFFTGNVYASVYFKNTGLTAAQRASAQAYCRSKAGL